MVKNPDSCTRLLQSCRTHDCIRQGKQLHLFLLKSGLDSSLFHGNCILQMYTRCGSDLTDARRLFDQMPHRNCFSWNSLIDAYSRSGDMPSSTELFNSAPQKNEYSWNAIIAGLVRHGDLNSARHVFEGMPIKDATAWNALIHGYFRHGQTQEAWTLYKKLNMDPMGPSSPWRDNFVLATVVSACARHMAYDYGRQTHAHIIVSRVELDSVICSALVDMYGKCGDLDSAIRVLDLMPEPDDFSISALISCYANCGRLGDARRIFDRRNSLSVVTWNSMVAGYVSNDQGEEAFQLFKLMLRDGVRPDSSTFASLLTACTSLDVLESGTQMQASALKLGLMEDIVVTTAIVDFYSKSGNSRDACKAFNGVKRHDTILFNSMIKLYSDCGRVQEARSIFDMIPRRTLISWNSMIVGYSQNGLAIEALDLFFEMHRMDLKFDEVTLASAVSACASISSLGIGEQIFALATVNGIESDHIISTSLVDLYCKCGNVKDARRLFDGMRKPDEVPWNSMMMGYATNGYGIEVLRLFEDMRNANIKLNELTFLGLLSGCCHCGLVEEGQKWFHTMKDMYDIDPTIEHYSCIVDLFVRAGRLEEAVEFIDAMPFEADASMWTSLLRGCKARGDESLGRRIAERLIEIDPQQPGAYVQLSGIFAGRGDWERSAQVREMMHVRQIKKNPGCSWIND